MRTSRYSSRAASASRSDPSQVRCSRPGLGRGTGPASTGDARDERGLLLVFDAAACFGNVIRQPITIETGSRKISGQATWATSGSALRAGQKIVRERRPVFRLGSASGLGGKAVAENRTTKRSKITAKRRRACSATIPNVQPVRSGASLIVFMVNSCWDRQRAVNRRAAGDARDNAPPVGFDRPIWQYFDFARAVVGDFGEASSSRDGDDIVFERVRRKSNCDGGRGSVI